MQMTHLIIARHQENLDWLFRLMESHRYIACTIYNDGDAIEVPSSLKGRIYVEPGDKVPCEPTKYVKYILEHWDDDITEDERLVFLQGDPLYHNYTLLEVFNHMEEWDRDYQNLTLFPHSFPGWGCSNEIANGTAPYITKFADNARVWHDVNMDDHFQGSYFKDDWLHYIQDISHGTTVSELCNEWGIARPDNVIKTYSAMFATNWNHIKKHSKSVWEAVNDFVVTGNHKTMNMSQKHRACIIEYMWSVLLHTECV